MDQATETKIRKERIKRRAKEAAEYDRIKALEENGGTTTDNANKINRIVAISLAFGLVVSMGITATVILRSGTKPPASVPAAPAPIAMEPSPTAIKTAPIDPGAELPSKGLNQPEASKKADSVELPRGFGIQGPQPSTINDTPTPNAPNIAPATSEASGSDLGGDTPAAQNPTQASSNNKAKGGVALETPSAPSAGNPIDTQDPRTIGITANDGPNKDYEETALTVQRTLAAQLDNGEKQLIRLKIPVMYKSRTLRLTGEQKQKAVELLARLQTEQDKLRALKSELESTLSDWNNLVLASTPTSALLPESPTLPQNQGTDKINRGTDGAMAPGKAISYEMLSPKK
jgi:hypothetical protein